MEQSEHGQATLVEDGMIEFEPARGYEGQTYFEIRAVDPWGAMGIGLVSVEVEPGKDTVSVEVLTATPDSSDDDVSPVETDTDQPIGITVFMPTVGDAISAVWANRIPLLALLALLAISLAGSRRLHVQLGTKPVPLAPTEGRRWSVVLVQEGHNLPVFAGPDRMFDVVARLHAQRTDLVGTGGVAQTGGVTWIEIEVGTTTGWVEGNNLVATPTTSLAMGSVTDTLELLASAVQGHDGLQAVVSGRGLFVSHHAPPFRLARKRVTAAVKDTTPFRWWSEEGEAPTISGAFGDIVVSPLLDAMIRSSYFDLSAEPEHDEVPSEFANLEHVALGTRDDGWVLCFERDGNDQPLLVALVRRGRVNQAALELLTR